MTCANGTHYFDFPAVGSTTACQCGELEFSVRKKEQHASAG